MVFNSRKLLLGCAWFVAFALPFGRASAEEGGVLPPSAPGNARPPMVLSSQGLAKYYGTWTEPSASPSAAPLVQAVAIPSSEPEASPSPEASTAPSPRPIGNTDLVRLRNSFERALSEERISVAHRQKTEMQQLKASQRQGLREWMKREKSARKDFFKKTESGNAKADWMKDRKVRYAKLRKEQEAELVRLRKSHASQRQALKRDQEDRRRAFEGAIQAGFLPGEELWPAKGK